MGRNPRSRRARGSRRGAGCAARGARSGHGHVEAAQVVVIELQHLQRAPVSKAASCTPARLLLARLSLTSLHGRAEGAGAQLGQVVVAEVEERELAEPLNVPSSSERSGVVPEVQVGQITVEDEEVLEDVLDAVTSHQQFARTSRGKGSGAGQSTVAAVHGVQVGAGAARGTRVRAGAAAGS